MRAFVVSIVALVGGCATVTPVSLDYTRPRVMRSNAGEIAVVVDDLRPPNRGGGGTIAGEVGVVRNTFGGSIGSQVALKPPQQALQELLSDCLAAAGYTVVDESNRVPTLRAKIVDLWSDGYIKYAMSLKMSIQLKGPDHAASWRFLLDAQSTVTLQVSAAELNGGYLKLMNDAAAELVAQFRGSEFRRGYQQASGTAAELATD